MTNIAEAELKNPFIATDRLPAYIQNFVRWQQEVAGIDNGLIDAVANPDLAEGQKYFKIGEKSKGNKRMSKAWKQHLVDTLEFLKKMMERLSQKINANLEYLDHLEHAIDESIEQLADKDPEKAEELKVIKNEVSEIKKQTKKQKEDLDEMADMEPPPTQTVLQRFAERVSNTTASARQATINFYNKMRPVQQAKMSAQSFAASEAAMRGYAGDTPEHKNNRPENPSAYKKAEKDEEDAEDDSQKKKKKKPAYGEKPAPDIN